MGSSQSDTNQERLSQLFPGMDTHTIQHTLDEANGDAGRAIVLLIQTPSTSSSGHGHDSSSNPYYKKQQITKARNRKVFIRQHLKDNNKCGIFWYYLSITFWIFIACLFITAILFAIFEIHFGSSITMTICFCSTIELMFTFLILYGIIHFEIWAIWITFIWSGLHGITIIYSIIQYAEHLDHDHLSFIYIGIVLTYWIAVIVFNLMFFKELKAAEKIYHRLVEETKNALKDKEKRPLRKESGHSRNRRGSSRSRKESRARVYTESKSNRRRNTRDGAGDRAKDTNHIIATNDMRKIASVSAYTSGSELNENENEQVVKSEDEHEYETSVVIKEDIDEDSETETGNGDESQNEVEEQMGLKVHGKKSDYKNHEMHLSTSLQITEAEIDGLMGHVDELEYNLSDMSEQP